MFQIAMSAALTAIAVAFTSRTRLPRAVLWAGALILVGAWAPLLLAAIFELGSDNPVGLGLLAWFASYPGLFLVGLGLLLRIREFAASR